MSFRETGDKKGSKKAVTSLTMHVLDFWLIEFHIFDDMIHVHVYHWV